MLQATRSAGGGYRRKKQKQQANNARKSVRFGHESHQRTNRTHKGQTSPYGSKHKHNRRKRKSTIFRPTHTGQSMGSMVHQSVFDDIDNPHPQSNQSRYQQYKHIKRRETLMQRNQELVKKSVMLNATQHQQLLDMVKNGQPDINTPINKALSKPTTPAPPSATQHISYSAATSPGIHGLDPTDNNSWRSTAEAARRRPMNPLDININPAASALIQSKSRPQSAVVTPIALGKLTNLKATTSAGASIRDQLDISQKELDEYKKQIESNITSRKRPSISIDNTYLTQQNTLRNDVPPQAFNNLINMQPNQLFTTPNSRRPSIVRQPIAMQIPNPSAAPIASMMMMIFQSLPVQQKNDLIQLMSFNLRQQQAAPNMLNNLAVAAAMDAAKRTNAANNLDVKAANPHPLATSKSMPSVMEDSAALTPRTLLPRKISSNALLKNRVRTESNSTANTANKSEITPQSTDQQHDFGLFEIREASEQSKSPLLPEHERLPSKEPIIGGVLSGIPSQYDTDLIKLAEEEQNIEEELQLEHEVVITPRSHIEDRDSDCDDLSETEHYLAKIDPHLLGDMPVAYDIEPQKSTEKKVRFKEPTPEPEAEPPQTQMYLASASSISLRIEDDITPLVEYAADADDEDIEEDEEEKTLTETVQDIQMTSLLQEMDRILDEKKAKDLLRTPEITVPSTSDLMSSPKQILLKGEYISAKQSADSNIEGSKDDHDAAEEESEVDARSRMSSKELFLKDIFFAIAQDELADDNSRDSHDDDQGHDLERLHTHHTMQSSSGSDGEVSHSESSKTDMEEPDKYVVRLHPSRYQEHMMGSERTHDGSTESAETLTTNTDRSKTVEDINTQRIGITPLQQHAIAAASMMDIGIDPHTEDGETEEDNPNYFGGHTPTAVREGTETIQKTLRAVWVRGHTRIGTLIHFFLIVINLIAAVMFVAAIEGYENEGLEYFFTSAFLVDFCVRLYAAKSAMAYLRSTKGIADFVSVMPGIILAITDFNADIPLWTFSFVRAMRVLRVLRLLAHMVNYEDYQEEERLDPIDVDANEFYNELNESEEKKPDRGCCTTKFWVMSKVTYFKLTLVSYLFMVVFVGAGLFACVEGPQSPTPTVSSFFESFYFIVCTVTTVGYGDFSPVTVEGQMCVILVIAVAFIVVPHRAAVLARLEFEYADQESEPSVMDFNMDQLHSEEEEEDEDIVQSFLGYCANCAGPRWTHGTEEMPISCMHCFHPVLTPDQVAEWFPDIAEALDEFITNEQNELLALMLDAKEGADNGLLPVFQQMVRGNIDPNIIVNAYANMNNQYSQQQIQQMQPGGMLTNTTNTAYASLYCTPIDATQYNIDPQLILASAMANAGVGGANGAVHNNIALQNKEVDLYNNSSYESQQQQSHEPQLLEAASSAMKNTKHMTSHSDMIAIEEETSAIVMESPQDLNKRHSYPKKATNEEENIEVIKDNNSNDNKPLQICVTPVVEKKIEAVNIEYIEYRTPSMEESETLHGFNAMHHSDSNEEDIDETQTPQNIYDNDDDDDNDEQKKEIQMITPISTASNISSGHMRKATPAELPSKRAIKKFSLDIKETPICEENEEFTPIGADSYIYTPEIDLRQSINSMITPEPNTVDSDIDDSYNDALDAYDNDDDEEKSIKPLKPKSTGDILKKHILNAIHTNDSKTTRNKQRGKHPKMKLKAKTNPRPRGGSYNGNYHYASTPNATSSDDRSDFDTDFEDDDDDDDDSGYNNNNNNTKASHSHIQQLSIIIDSAAPKARERAHTTMSTKSPQQTYGAIISNDSLPKYNSTSRLHDNNRSNHKKDKRDKKDRKHKKDKRDKKRKHKKHLDNNDIDDDEITPQEYEQMMRFYHKLDAAQASTNSPKVRHTTKEERKNHPLTRSQQRLSKQRESQIKMEMLTKKLLAAQIASEAANSVQKVERSKHRAYKSEHLNIRSLEIEENRSPRDRIGLSTVKSNPPKFAAFHQHAAIAKSMTDLFMVEKMNRQPVKRKGGKGNKRVVNNYNPMAEHMTNKVFENIESQLGSDAAAAQISSILPDITSIAPKKVSTPTLQSPVLAVYDKPMTKYKPNKNKKKKNTKKKKVRK